MNNLNEYEFNTELLNESYEYEHESLELELANELSAVSNEYELENFLGSIWNTAKQLYNSPAGQAMKNKFVAGAKSYGRKMLPAIGQRIGGFAGNALGSRLGGRFGGASGARMGGQIGSDMGSQLGGQLGGAASNWLFGGGGEQEETVDYVRVIRKAANYLNKALSDGATGSPTTMVTQAINKAAAPVMRKRRTISNYSAPKSGRWVRQGNRLIIMGVR